MIYSNDNVTLGSNVNFICDTSNGNKIATDPSQKIAFFGQTPTSQPSDSGSAAGFSMNAGQNVYSLSTFSGGGGTAYTIDDIVKALKQLGLLSQ